ncbi:hypothetical protein FOZ62_024369 [Perkinsus olseni]|uniref:Purple acid phosphatase n=1 Tax=Perkinsus olseni TaxID=32597 RepID=A0A7J6RB12_PEROL|nr:hypothetical protein FOZ62_024369 [Perkinsus olseni]
MRPTSFHGTHLLLVMVPAALLLSTLFFAIGLVITGCSGNSPTPGPSPATTARPTAGSCVSVSPAELEHSYDPVKVTWHESVKEGDIIAFSLKNKSDPFQGDAFRIILSALDDSTNEYQLNLVNPRGGGYTVSYRTADGTEVCSTDLTFAQGDDEPTQAYVTVVGDDNLQVHWVSASSEQGSVSHQRPGTTTPTRYDETSRPRTYNGQDMCSALAIFIGFRDPGYFHSVTIPNLEPGSVITIHNAASVSRSFSPHPRIPASDPTRHSVALLGDLGVNGNHISGAHGLGTMEFPPPDPSPSLVHLQENERLRLTILYGDLAYANGYGIIWDQFGAEMEDRFAMRTPFVTSVGNHEYVSTGNPEGWYPDFGNYDQLDSGGECGVPFSHRYPIGDGSKANYWFSFDFGLVHYVMMSTEHNYLNGSAQHQWLEDDLANVDRTKTPWVIVTGHRAMYQTCKGFQLDQEVAEHLISDVGPLLTKNRVDVFVAGHYHLYERTAAINGVVHVLAGSPRLMEGPCERMKTPWYRKGLLTHGYVELDVVNSSLLNFTYWGYNATLGSITVQDAFYVSKP